MAITGWIPIARPGHKDRFYTAARISYGKHVSGIYEIWRNWVWFRLVDRDEEAVRRFVESFASALVDAGMPQMPALVFVALLATDQGGPTAEELAAQLQVSRAAISGAVKYLGHFGLTTRERQPGTRRHRYVLGSPTWFELVSRRERVLDRWITTTREGIDALGPTTPAGQRLAESLAFFLIPARRSGISHGSLEARQASHGTRPARTLEQLTPGLEQRTLMSRAPNRPEGGAITVLARGSTTSEDLPSGAGRHIASLSVGASCT